jgi:putative membrane protein
MSLEVKRYVGAMAAQRFACFCGQCGASWGVQSNEKRILRFLGNWAINTLAVAVAVAILRGHITYQSWSDLVIAALLLGLLNAFVRPILIVLALPLVIFTLGLFTLVINALILYFVGVLMKPHFQVDRFLFAFLGALIITLVSLALNLITGGNTRVTIQRRPPPSKKDDDVIDV